MRLVRIQMRCNVSFDAQSQNFKRGTDRHRLHIRLVRKSVTRMERRGGRRGLHSGASLRGGDDQARTGSLVLSGDSDPNIPAHGDTDRFGNYFVDSGRDLSVSAARRSDGYCRRDYEVRRFSSEQIHAPQQHLPSRELRGSTRRTARNVLPDTSRASSRRDFTIRFHRGIPTV